LFEKITFLFGGAREHVNWRERRNTKEKVAVMVGEAGNSSCTVLSHKWCNSFGEKKGMVL